MTLLSANQNAYIFRANDKNIYAIFLYDVVYLPCENILFTVYLFKLLGAIIWSNRRNFTMWYYGGDYLAMENI